ncbi:hypothetical protein C4580_00780 [Candidatus Woesearchaeota archaeon]|nr:MAG: hypothetical protein C4580_00780 [Candidatus Woesearchaeota archaeon]
MLSQPQPSSQQTSLLPPPSVSGGFTVPAPREYGGAIRGVAIEGSRAFPGGRAIETDIQNCYTCSCISSGITSIDRAIAEKVCADNCGGRIVQEQAGPCR